jgi:hypothetical protein
MELPVNYDKTHYTVRKLVREEYVRLQEGKCWFCKKLLTEEPSKKVTSKPIDKSLFPPNMLKYPVHLHHCRKSGLTIGATHSRCNAYMWQYQGV